MNKKNVDVENLKKHRLEYKHYQNEQKRKQKEEDRKNTYPYCYGPYYISLYMEGKVKEKNLFKKGSFQKHKKMI